MPKHRSIAVSLVDLGSIVEEFHYGPYSRFWWKMSTDKENATFFPLRIGQKTKTCLNSRNFFVTIVVGISSQVDWLNAGSEYKSSLIYKFNGNKQAIYVSKIEEDKCILEIYQDNQMKKKYEGETPIAVWKKSELMKKYNGNLLFGLENSFVQTLIHQHKDVGSYNVTPWSNKESEYQFWTRSSQPEQDRATLQQLSKIGFLVSTPIHMPNKTKTFWNSFRRALDDNKQNSDGKRRVLSIIADEFSYSELETNLNVGIKILYNKNS
ncbi:unnamed protein product [Rhizophagus irregularis]|nr:unnamed protein product [Rhizophagus irregularis]